VETVVVVDPVKKTIRKPKTKPNARRLFGSLKTNNKNNIKYGYTTNKYLIMKCTACTDQKTRSETRPVIVVGTILGLGLLCYLAVYKRGK